MKHTMKILNDRLLICVIRQISTHNITKSKQKKKENTEVIFLLQKALTLDCQILWVCVCGFIIIIIFIIIFILIPVIAFK